MNNRIRFPTLLAFLLVLLVAGAALAAPIARPALAEWRQVLSGQGTALILQQMTATAGTRVLDLQDDSGTSVWSVTREGNVIASGSTSVGGAAGAAGTRSSVTRTVTALANNTATTIATITVPNTTIAGAGIEVQVAGTLGDGDSTDSENYLISVSRIAGAATQAAIGSAFGTATTTGATANATTSVTLAAASGATSATQTIAVQVTVARSAGTASNHRATATLGMLNSWAAGITVS